RGHAAQPVHVPVSQRTISQRALRCEKRVDLGAQGPRRPGVTEEERTVLRGAAEAAIGYLDGLAERQVRPDPTVDLSAFEGPMPDQPSQPAEVMEMMTRHAGAGTMAMAGPRFFGWVDRKSVV